MSTSQFIIDVFSVTGGVLGILTYIGYLRGKKYPKKFNLYVLDNVKIACAENELGEKIKITNGNQPITGGVSYFKGLFSSVGREDADLRGDKKKDNVRISLPAPCKWLEVRNVKKSEGLDVNIAIDNDDPATLVVEGALLKKTEFFSFDAFYEGDLSNKRSAKDIVSVKHRIKDTGKTDVEFLTKEKKSKGKIISSSILSVLALFALCLGLLYSCIMVMQKPIRFQKSGDDSLSIQYSVEYYSSDSVRVIRMDGTSEKDAQIYSLSEFNKNYDVTIVKNDKLIFNIVMLVIYAIMLIMFVISLIKWTLRGLNARHILEAYNKVTT